jgi:hypothetical protein
MVPLTQAANNTLYGKVLNSFVQVKATTYEPKSIPAYFKFHGIQKVGKEIYDYEFDLEIDESNMHHALGLTQQSAQAKLYIKTVLFYRALRDTSDVPEE